MDPGSVAPAASGDEGLRVTFPFLLKLEHNAIGTRAMFETSRAFDFHESDSDRSLLHVDVELVQPTQTTLFVTPQRPMSYAEIATEVEGMLADLGPKLFGGVPRVSELDWLVANKGEHSRGREFIGRIQ